MEVHFKPDVQAKLDQMARETGRPSSELVNIPIHSFRATDSKVRFHVKSRGGGVLPARKPVQ